MWRGPNSYLKDEATICDVNFDDDDVYDALLVGGCDFRCFATASESNACAFTCRDLYTLAHALIIIT